MPYIATETLVAGALLIVLAFGWQYLPSGSSSNASTSSGGGGGGASKNKKKNKKKNKAEVGPAPDVKIPPSQPEPAQQSEARQANKVKPKTLAEKLLPKEPKTRVDDMLAPEDRPPQLARVMKVSSASASAFASPPKPAPSFAAAAADTSSNQPGGAGATTSVTPPDQKVAKFQDDYADSDDGSEEDESSLSASASASASGSGVGAIVNGHQGGDGRTTKKADDGWDVVTSKKKKPISISLSGTASNPTTTGAGSTSLPLPIASRGQKKNAKKAEAKKASRAAEEEDRQRRLAMHKRDLERERINELYASNQKPSRGKALGNNKNGLGGGAHATITPNGKLVWD